MVQRPSHRHIAKGNVRLVLFGSHPNCPAKHMSHISLKWTPLSYKVHQVQLYEYGNRVL